MTRKSAFFLPQLVKHSRRRMATYPKYVLQLSLSTISLIIAGSPASAADFGIDCPGPSFGYFLGAHEAVEESVRRNPAIPNKPDPDGVEKLIGLEYAKRPDRGVPVDAEGQILGFFRIAQRRLRSQLARQT
jgi:hypothetical protein